MATKQPNKGESQEAIQRAEHSDAVEGSMNTHKQDAPAHDGTTDVLESAVDRAAKADSYEAAFGVHLDESEEERARRLRVSKALSDAQATADAKQSEFTDAFNDAADNKITRHNT